MGGFQELWREQWTSNHGGVLGLLSTGKGGFKRRVKGISFICASQN